ncbi:MAG: hypothetical protein CMH52_07740 [Myxococcales bacterium]|nr:hypothetical protein [Myxococcales bacterium]
MSDNMSRKLSLHREPYREFTIEALLVGALIGVIMTCAFVYIGLKLGFTMGGSTVAAILGFGLLRGVLKKGTIIENNINQTVASGVNTASAGIVFTLPALFLLSATDTSITVEPLPAILAAIGGSFLGVAVIIPLRKQMIEFERLKFPSGVAVGTLLKSPGAGIHQAKMLAIGVILATTIHILCNVKILPDEIDIGGPLGLPMSVPLIVYVSFASLGAGLLSGSGGLPFVFGGVLAWWLISPIAIGLGWVPSQAALPATDWVGHAAWSNQVLYGEMLRPLGIGVLIGGAFAGVVASFPALKSAIKSLSQAAKAGGQGGSEELSSRVLYAGMIGSVIILFFAAMTSSPDITVGQGIGIAFVGTIWLALAGLIVAQATGMTDISPLSGMSLIGVTLMFFMSGGNAVSAIILGVAVCVGIGQCADMMGDLKAGHLVGAQPRKQQLAQFAVGWLGVPVAVGVLFFLWNSVGFGSDINPELSAPQGDALAQVIKSLGEGAAPLDKYLGGAAIGLGLGLFPVPGLGVLIGLAMYLPFSITLTYGIGCLGSIYLSRRKGQEWIGSTLVPIAAGFIIGEAVTNLVAAMIMGLTAA